MIRDNLFQPAAITAFLIFMTISSMGQDSYLKNRWNIKLSGAPQLNISGKRHNSFLMAEANYGILNNIELGIALGFEKTITLKLKPEASHPQDYYSESFNSPLYNIHLNYHLMPYLVKEKKSRFDLYLSGRLGGNYHKSVFTDKYLFWNYYLGGGLAWYFTRNFGVYTEYGRQYSFSSDYITTGLRFGIGVKF